MNHLDYSKAKDWTVSEVVFDSGVLGKCEAMMSLGNGYMGLRSATEERYLLEKRGLFVAGTFNKFDENEVTELPNVADFLTMDIRINGTLFSLDQGTIKHYERNLCVKNGKLTRFIHWVSPKGDEIQIAFERFVSKKRLHTIAQRVVITALNKEVKVLLLTGINGRMTNTGSQHFSEGDKRLFDKIFMQYTQTTTESKIDFVLTTGLKFYKEEKEYAPKSRIIMERRTIESEYVFDLKAGQEIIIEKITDVRSSRDLTNEGKSLDMIKEEGLTECKENYALGFELLFEESANEWKKEVWDKSLITIVSNDELDQLAIRFAQYHLHVMTPAHDYRMNIAAKGLSGEGYKGHTFWDTEIFALPYFTFTHPHIARSLEKYRYLSLPGAHKKSKENNYEGAQYPWEAGWLDDGEVTPIWGAADILTGLPTKIWSGFIEQHITCDVAFGIWQYYKVTNDQEFMDKYGYELMMDTAKFWASRLEYSEIDGMYHINEVVGPDEYKEHVDDNAFTNYMAHWNIKMAISYYEELKENKPEIFKHLNEKLELDRVYKVWQERVSLIFLPKPREDLLIAQDATYLTLDEIDLTEYKKQEQVGSLFLEYNLETVNKLQVSKQADLMILFLLMEDLFSHEVKQKNFEYYEAHTLHDSSLSLSTHSILANDLGDTKMSYDLFKRARAIDLGQNMKSSNDGIHAGSIAGIWQCTVFGFGGVRMLGGQLRIEPKLPKHWEHLSFTVHWQQEELFIEIYQNNFAITNKTGSKPIFFVNKDKEYKVETKTVVEYV